MFSYFQAIIFGLLQGITELFPISSLGHSVLLPSLLRWQVNQKDPSFLTFLVATHAATALVLFLFFLPDWKRIIVGVLQSLQMREVKGTDAQLGWLLIVGTIPAGILGLLFEDRLKNLFASPRFVAITLIFNGLLLLSVEWYKKKTKEKHITQHSDERIAKLSYKQTLFIGCMQSIALLPGFSRTGTTLTGGLLTNLNHEDAARFSFLLATPVIGAAALLKLPELATASEARMIGPTLVGAVAAGIAAYFSVTFLTKYFQTNKLTPFGIYCVIVGGICSLLFFFAW